jgi:NADH-quinone oxidoreductase subunit A
VVPSPVTPAISFRISTPFFSLYLCKKSRIHLNNKTHHGDSMETIATQYFPILVFLGIAFAVALIMICAPMVIGRQKPDTEKLSAYECGFEPFGDARGKFDVRFYLVAILFIIFDLEIAFLFPWAVSLETIGVFGFWSMMVFLGVLTVGFMYEWKKGALEWE